MQVGRKKILALWFGVALLGLAGEAWAQDRQQPCNCMTHTRYVSWSCWSDENNPFSRTPPGQICRQVTVCDPDSYCTQYDDTYYSLERQRWVSRIYDIPSDPTLSTGFGHTHTKKECMSAALSSSVWMCENPPAETSDRSSTSGRESSD